MEPGRDATDPDLGRVDGQGGDEGVAAGPVAPQVPVDLAACSGLPGTASTISLNRPRSPTMLADRIRIPIANSETGH
jgi:hypothetical protein